MDLQAHDLIERVVVQEDYSIVLENGIVLIELESFTNFNNDFVNRLIADRHEVENGILRPVLLDVSRLTRINYDAIISFQQQFEETSSIALGLLINNEMSSIIARSIKNSTSYSIPVNIFSNTKKAEKWCNDYKLFS